MEDVLCVSYSPFIKRTSTCQTSSSQKQKNQDTAACSGFDFFGKTCWIIGGILAYLFLKTLLCVLVFKFHWIPIHTLELKACAQPFKTAISSAKGGRLERVRPDHHEVTFFYLAAVHEACFIMQLLAIHAASVDIFAVTQMFHVLVNINLSDVHQ